MEFKYSKSSEIIFSIYYTTLNLYSRKSQLLAGFFSHFDILENNFVNNNI